MPVDRAQTSQGSREPGGPTAADLIDQVGRFDGPPQQFLAHLVAIQCRVGPAEGGVVLRPGAQEQIGILAVHPPLTKGATPPRWLAEAAESAPQVISTGRAIERPLHAPEDLYGQPARRHRQGRKRTLRTRPGHQPRPPDRPGRPGRRRTRVLRGPPELQVALTEIGRAQGTLLDDIGIELVDPEAKSAK